jgi:acetyl/propionyl-CoA carboxylase alpha subunit
VSADEARARGQRTTFDVVVNGRPWRVVVEPEGTGRRYHVGVKGRRRRLDVAWIDETTVSMIDVGSAASLVKEAGISVKPGGELTIALGGRLLAVSVASRDTSAHLHAPLPREATTNGPLSVVAPMPGRVVRLLVAEGDRVVAGQGVVVVEAMKMENELRASKDGVVRQVRTRAGDAVEAGAVLVVVE